MRNAYEIKQRSLDTDNPDAKRGSLSHPFRLISGQTTVISLFALWESHVWPPQSRGICSHDTCVCILPDTVWPCGACPLPLAQPALVVNLAP